jgi:hypothetical protein
MLLMLEGWSCRWRSTMRLPQLPLRRIRTRARDRRTGVSVPPSARVQTTSGSRTHNAAPNLAVHCVAKTVHVPMSPWARAPRCGTRPAAPHRVDHEPSANEPASRLAQRPPLPTTALPPPATTANHVHYFFTLYLYSGCARPPITASRAASPRANAAPTPRVVRSRRTRDRSCDAVCGDNGSI